MSNDQPEDKTAPGLLDYEASKPLILNNKTCPYCGCDLTQAIDSDKEHVIARNFVPKGTLQSQWNLIVRACRTCNGAKADLENDISAISMYPTLDGQFAADDHRLHDAARRKTRAINRRTRKSVGEPEPPIDVRGNFMGAQITFTFRAPPQAAEERLYDLARRQIQAFFYFLTYDPQSGRGRFWPGVFCPLLAVRRPDWGNAQQLWFQEYTKEWLFRFHGGTAEGFFKLWIKRKSESEAVWAWALEWNQNFRLVGFFGDTEFCDALDAIVPGLEMDHEHRDGNQFFRARLEVPLVPENDFLFAEPSTASASSSAQIP
ncbi:MAG TPA: hypothetical protein VFV07_04195 [Rhizomicrobium sp.]|nr:hypothetical protein [Rhizomicrobium sp.]